jgi:hypothetical protein
LATKAPLHFGSDQLLHLPCPFRCPTQGAGKRLLFTNSLRLCVFLALSPGVCTLVWFLALLSSWLRFACELPRVNFGSLSFVSVARTALAVDQNALQTASPTASASSGKDFGRKALTVLNILRPFTIRRSHITLSILGQHRPETTF